MWLAMCANSVFDDMQFRFWPKRELLLQSLWSGRFRRNMGIRERSYIWLI